MNIFKGKMDPDDSRDIGIGDDLVTQAQQLIKLQRDAMCLPPRNYPEGLIHAEIVSVVAKAVQWDFNQKPFPAAVTSMQKALMFSNALAMYGELKNAVALLSGMASTSSQAYAAKQQLMARIEELLRRVEGKV